MPTGDYNGPERRGPHRIPEHVLDKIAEKAALRALDKVYVEVGKSVLKKLAWFVGIAAVALVLIFSKDWKEAVRVLVDSP